MAQILLVGTATLDIVFTLAAYPAEDDEVRAQAMRIARGGNAGNSAVVLAQLGHRCDFIGVLADVPETAVIERDFAAHRVGYEYCPRHPGRPPTSSIQLAPCSRTIVHYRDLPELSAEQFAIADLAACDWVHFEGRNVPELLKMLAHVRSERPDVTISLELEKPREGIEQAAKFADVLICSRHYARHRGFEDPQEFLGWLRAQASQAELVVAWGEAGAYAKGRDDRFSHSPAFPPARVVDTLGAGDAFNAGLISSLTQGAELPEALERGCRIAGKKCGFFGFSLTSSSDL